MEITSLKDMYIAELQELASVERQLDEALMRMAELASHASLKNALIHHREQTLLQGQRLETILQKHRASPRAHTDQAMQALIDEAEKMASMVKGDGLRDAAIIASVQKIEHYEIAAYGTAAALAGQLDLRDEQQTLYQILGEEKAADATLTGLAKREVNQGAVTA
jgi:ferritin-like metal-binding protein YciE